MNQSRCLDNNARNGVVKANLLNVLAKSLIPAIYSHAGGGVRNGQYYRYRGRWVRSASCLYPMRALHLVGAFKSLEQVRRGCHSPEHLKNSLLVSKHSNIVIFPYPSQSFSWLINCGWSETGPFIYLIHVMLWNKNNNNKLCFILNESLTSSS